MTNGTIDGTPFKCRSIHDLVVFNLVKLRKYVMRTGLRFDWGPTLIFNDSIRFGFKAPVANPKSVSLTWPVPSTKKFCRQL